MTERKAIALIAHDQKKDDLADFARSHRKAMSAYPIVATGTTGGRIIRGLPGSDVDAAQERAPWRRPADRRPDRHRRGRPGASFLSIR
jgi:hypothetical protein